MAYLGYYGAKVVGIFFNLLKQNKIIGTLPFEGILSLMLVVAFLGLAGTVEAKSKKRLDNVPITEQTEADSFLRRLLY